MSIEKDTVDVNQRASKIGLASGAIGLGVGASFLDAKASSFVMNSPLKYTLFPVMIGFMALQSVKDWMLVHKARMAKSEGGKSGLFGKIVQAILSTIVSVSLVTALVLLFLGVLTVAPFLLIGGFAFGTLLQGVAAVGDTVSAVKAFIEYRRGLKTEPDCVEAKKQLDTLRQKLSVSVDKQSQDRLKTEAEPLLAQYDPHQERYSYYHEKSQKAIRSWMKFGAGVVGVIVFAMALIFAPGVIIPALAGINVAVSVLGFGINVHESLEQAKEAKSQSQSQSQPQPQSVSGVVATVSPEPEPVPALAPVSASPDPVQALPQATGSALKTAAETGEPRPPSRAAPSSPASAGLFSFYPPSGNSLRLDSVDSRVFAP